MVGSLEHLRVMGNKGCLRDIGRGQAVRMGWEGVSVIGKGVVMEVRAVRVWLWLG